LDGCTAPVGPHALPRYNPGAMTDEVRAPAPAALASGLVFAIVFFIVAAGWASFTIIQPGNVGVVFNRWSGALKTVGQGVAWRIPWITQVHIQGDLQVQMNKMGFVVDKVNLGASHLPDAIEKQMQQKMGAQQNAQQADYELQRQQTLAKAKVAEAEGDAQATLVKARAQA